MLVYRKHFHGLHLVFQVYGSAVLRTLPFGLIAVLQSLLHYLLSNSEQDKFFYPGGVSLFPVLASVVSFIVIFRQNVSYNRYHEGRVRLQAMTAAWTDSCTKALSFDGGCGRGGVSQHSAAAAAASAARFRLELVHLYSLMHALALQFLRSDWQLENLTLHNEEQLPPWDSTQLGYKPALLDYFVLRGTFSRRLLANSASPLPVIGMLNESERAMLTHKGLARVNTMNVQWCLAQQLKANGKGRNGARGSKAARETAGALGDTAAGAAGEDMLPDGGAEQRRSSAASRLRGETIRISNPLRSLRGKAARLLQAFWQPSVGKYYRGAAERVYQAYYWTQERLRLRMAEGGLDMPAPVLATAWTTLAQGLENFEQCRYLCDTPFPFPWAQLVVVLLLFNQFLLPFLVISAIKSVPVGTIFCAVTVQATWALNEVARELEDPFLFEPNNLPLSRLNYQFNERILAVANSCLPSLPDLAGVAQVVSAAAAGSRSAPDAVVQSMLPSESRESLPDLEAGKL